MRDCDDDISRLLALAGDNNQAAKESLFRIVYDQLRSVASRLIRGMDAGDLQTTALVHEAFLRFERGNHLASFANRRVFFSVAVRAMQQILIDHQRHRRRALDGRGNRQEPMSLLIASIETRSNCEIGALLGAMRELERESPRLHAVVSYRFFAGMSYQKVAELLEISVGTAERDWRLARAKLMRLIQTRDDLDYS